MERAVWQIDDYERLRRFINSLSDEDKKILNSTESSSQLTQKKVSGT